MREFLIFQLTAQLGAMGELAGHERRGSWGWPGRSAILGLLAAALGIRREGDFAAVDRLGLAVAVFDEGAALRDFHTAESVRSGVRHPQSRAEALARGRAVGKTDTTITLRDYRGGVLYGVAIWGEELERLAIALRAPVYPLYLGRKSCPLAAPLDPRIVGAPDAKAALASLRLPPWRTGAVALRLATEEEGSDGRIETRQDRPLDRQRWHFGPRAVRIVSCRIAPEPVA
jgi:CRISPR system Cascade subunit CasD